MGCGQYCTNNENQQRDTTTTRTNTKTQQQDKTTRHHHSDQAYFSTSFVLTLLTMSRYLVMVAFVLAISPSRARCSFLRVSNFIPVSCSVDNRRTNVFCTEPRQQTPGRNQVKPLQSDACVNTTVNDNERNIPYPRRNLRPCTTNFPRRITAPKTIPSPRRPRIPSGYC